MIGIDRGAAVGTALAKSRVMMPIAIHIRPGRTSGYVQAYSPDLAGCSAAAPSEEEALRLVGQRIRDYIEDARVNLLPRVPREVEISLLAQTELMQ